MTSTGRTGFAFPPTSAVSISPIRVSNSRTIPCSTSGERLSNDRVFHKVSPGCADGFRCDENGNIWTSAGDGVHCVDPSGALLGKILVPSPVGNLTFGGRYRSRLFICASQTLYAIYTNQRGAQRP
jgi:gluconolactonase